MKKDKSINKMSKTYSKIKFNHKESSLSKHTSVKNTDALLHKNIDHVLHKSYDNIVYQNIDTLLHESLINKNKTLSIMIKNLHGYLTNIEDLEWIMNETEKIIKDILESTTDTNTSPHKILINNLHQEIIKLISRFTGLDKKSTLELTLPLKDNRKMHNNENVNLMNFKKTETIASFKYMDTENEEELPTDFAHISLPLLPHDHNTSHHKSKENNEAKIKQYEATISILKEEMEKENLENEKIKKDLQNRVMILNKKLENCHSEWEAYKSYAGSCIRRCKIHLNELALSGESSGVENMLDELFSWENKLDRRVIEGNLSEIENLKQEKIKEILEIEKELIDKKEQLSQIQTQRTKTQQYQQYQQHPQQQLQQTGPKSTFSEENLIRMLYLQAAAIEQLV